MVPYGGSCDASRGAVDRCSDQYVCESTLSGGAHCSTDPAICDAAIAQVNAEAVEQKGARITVTYKDVPDWAKTQEGAWTRRMLDGTNIWDYLQIPSAETKERSKFLRYLPDPAGATTCDPGKSGICNNEPGKAMHKACSQPSNDDLKLGFSGAALCTGSCGGDWKEEGTLSIDLPPPTSEEQKNGERLAFSKGMKLQVRGAKAKCSARCHQWKTDTWSSWQSVQVPDSATQDNGFGEIELSHCGPSADKLQIKGGGNCGSCYPAHVGVHHITPGSDPFLSDAFTINSFMSMISMLAQRFPDGNYENDLLYTFVHAYVWDILPAQVYGYGHSEMTTHPEGIEFTADDFPQNLRRWMDNFGKNMWKMDLAKNDHNSHNCGSNLRGYDEYKTRIRCALDPSCDGDAHDVSEYILDLFLSTVHQTSVKKINKWARDHSHWHSLSNCGQGCGTGDMITDESTEVSTGNAWKADFKSSAVRKRAAKTVAFNLALPKMLDELKMHQDSGKYTVNLMHVALRLLHFLDNEPNQPSYNLVLKAWGCYSNDVFDQTKQSLSGRNSVEPWFNLPITRLVTQSATDGPMLRMLDCGPIGDMCLCGRPFSKCYYSAYKDPGHGCYPWPNDHQDKANHGTGHCDRNDGIPGWLLSKLNRGRSGGDMEGPYKTMSNCRFRFNSHPLTEAAGVERIESWKFPNYNYPTSWNGYGGASNAPASQISWTDPE